MYVSWFKLSVYKISNLKEPKEPEILDLKFDSQQYNVLENIERRFENEYQKWRFCRDSF